MLKIKVTATALMSEKNVIHLFQIKEKYSIINSET